MFRVLPPLAFSRQSYPKPMGCMGVYRIQVVFVRRPSALRSQPDWSGFVRNPRSASGPASGSMSDRL